MYTQRPDLKDLPDPYLPAQKALITHVDRRLEAKVRRRLALERFERDLEKRDRDDRRTLAGCVVLMLVLAALAYFFG